MNILVVDVSSKKRRSGMSDNVKYVLKCCTDGHSKDSWNIVDHNNNLFIAVGFNYDRMAELVRRANAWEAMRVWIESNATVVTESLGEMAFVCNDCGCQMPEGKQFCDRYDFCELAAALRDCEVTP